MRGGACLGWQAVPLLTVIRVEMESLVVFVTAGSGRERNAMRRAGVDWGACHSPLSTSRNLYEAVQLTAQPVVPVAALSRAGYTPSVCPNLIKRPFSF